MSVPTKEQLKARSKHLSKLLEEKYNIKVSHGHCLDVIAQLFGHKDWNIASAVSPDENSSSTESKPQMTPWLEALTKGYHLSVEQPYHKEQFHVGGAVGQRMSEQGVLSLEFTPRVDDNARLVVLTLPLSKTVLTNDHVTNMHKQQYFRREKEFAEKLGGRAEDLIKK